MNSKVIIVCATLLFVFLTSLESCKKSTASSETGITRFTFAANDSAPDLKNIAFKVDLNNGRIYNVDSVAYTSNLTKVVPKVGCVSAPSEIRINDKAWNQVDPIDASNPFKLTIVAADKKTIRDVTVTVIKHKVNSDEIIWSELSNNIDITFNCAKVLVVNGIPVLIGTSTDGKTYVYTSYDAETWFQKSSGTWDINLSTLYISPNLDEETIAALGNDNSIYLMSADFTFLKVADIPNDYTALDIIGAYDILDTKIVILAKNNESENTILGFDIETGIIENIGFNNPSYFPEQGGAAKVCITNTSSAYESRMIVSYLLGGLDEDGNFLNTAFSSDNMWYWTDVRKSPLEEKYIFPSIKNAGATCYDKKIFMIGGQTESGYLDKMYVSDDKGYSWYESKYYQNIPFQDFRLKYGCNIVSDKDGNIYVLGGFTDSGEFVLDSYKGRARHFDFIQ
ncbi:MAG: DUF6242 domain-containing protein [Paludibacteraceae bacterium]|nr:DUF6242 domain-containing protein [Paludibacteraceae bacterium]